MGRVDRAYDEHSDVKLITDPASRVAVEIARTHEPAILEGMGEDLCRLRVPSAQPVVEGDMVQTSGGGFQDFFSADSDSFRLDARTLELGLIYEWRSRKGLDFQDELADFNAALSRCISDDKGARILTQRSRQQIDARIAYPWNLG